MFGVNDPIQMGDEVISGRLLFYCALVGLIVTGLIVWVTEYYTSTEYRPVRSVAKSSETGHGNHVIQGLAVSMEACALPAMIIALGIIAASLCAGVFGIGSAPTTLRATSRTGVAAHAYSR